jgi:ParB-like chromosome segregation protein Spo0J
MVAVEESADVDAVVAMDGVKHLHGNLYRVRLSIIQLAENTKKEKGVLSFQNPRHILSSGKPKGFSKEEMNELREAIRTEGLENPLLLRLIEIDGKKILQLVSGERRYRSLLKLVESKAECFDPATGKTAKADKLFEYVDVRINTHMDDKAAFKHAFSGNDKAIGIGEGATIALIREYRTAGWTDGDIMEATGKSITWLKDSDVLIGLDEHTFTALTNDQINRSAALDLAKIEDVAERLEVLDAARNFASKRLSAMKKKLESEVAAAESKAEVAEGEAVEAEMTGDDEAAEAAQKKAEKLQKKAKAKKREVEEVNEQPRVTGKDLQKAKAGRKKPGANPGGTNDDGTAALTKAKIQKFWYEPCVSLIKHDGQTDDGEPVEIDLEDAHLVKYLCEQMEKGERDIVKILKHHQKAKDRRAG